VLEPVTKNSTWLLLEEAGRRLNLLQKAAAEIIGRGQIPVSARRSDVHIGLPEPVERLLAAAKSTFVSFGDNRISAVYDKTTDRSIFGARSNVELRSMRLDMDNLSHLRAIDFDLTFYVVRVNWPELVGALEAAGCPLVAPARSLLIDGGEPPLRSATDQKIHDAISAAYDQATLSRQKPPNVREVAKPAQAILRATGYDASKNRITNLAEDRRHAERRWPVGKRRTSESRGKSK